MTRVRRRNLTPSEMRRHESQRTQPVCWAQWVVITALLGGFAGGTIWLGIQVFTWATSSPTAHLVLR